MLYLRHGSLRVFLMSDSGIKKVSRSQGFYAISKWPRLLDTPFHFALAQKKSTRSDNGYNNHEL